MVVALKSGIIFIRRAPEPLPRLHCNQNQRRFTFELPAAADTGLLSANPSFIHFYLAVQRLPSNMNHGPAEFMKHHPKASIRGQTELPLNKQGRDPALVSSHQVGGPEPMGQLNLGPVKNRSGGE